MKNIIHYTNLAAQSARVTLLVHKKNKSLQMGNWLIVGQDNWFQFAKYDPVIHVNLEDFVDFRFICRGNT